MTPLPLRSLALGLLLLGPAAHADTFTVTTTDDSGSGSLREAIMAANANPGEDTIAFDLPGTGPFVIEATQSLPPISSPVVINATTQPGYDGTPVVEVAGTGSTGFFFGAGSDGSVLTGLAVGGFGTAVYVSGSDDIVLRNTWLGFTADGTPNGFGVGALIEDSDGTQIGGEAPGEGLTIGHGQTGLRLDNATGTEVVNTRIGSGPSGQMPAPFTGSAVTVVNGSEVTFRGTQPGACLINSAAEHGVRLITDALATVDGCYIGLGADGATDLGNGADGIHVEPTAGGADVLNSVISGNGFQGIGINGPGPEVRVDGSLIGMSADGTECVPNFRGLGVFNTSGVEVTNTVITGNEPNVNVLLSGSVTTDTYVGGVWVNVADMDGDGRPETVMDDGRPGVLIQEGAHDNQIGGTEPGEGNVFGVGDDTPGIALVGEETDRNTVQNPVGSPFGLAQETVLLNLIDLCDDGTATPPSCGANANILSPEIQEARYRAPQEIEVNYWYNDDAFQGFVNTIFFALSDFTAEPRGGEGGPYQLVVIGGDTYTEEDYDACGDPPCPKTVTFTSPFPLESGDLIVAAATDTDGNTSELSAPAAVTVDGEDGPATPEPLALHAGYPNPFAARTTIRYTLPEAARVRLAVYDVLGRAVAVLVDEEQPAGERSVVFDGRGLSSGLYVVRLEAGAREATGRLVLAR